MKSIIISALVLVLNQFCYAEEGFNWQIEKGNKSTNFVANVFEKDSMKTIGVDKSELGVVANFASKSTDGEEEFAIAISEQKDGLRKSTAVRARLPLHFNILRIGSFGLKNEGSLAVGILGGMSVYKGKTNAEFTQRLYGVRNELVSNFSFRKTKFGLRAGAEVVSADFSDDYEKVKNKWDNYSVRYGANARSQLSKKMSLGVSAEGWRKKYNPEKYFFLEKWTSDDHILAATTFLLNNRFELSPTVGYKRFNLERDNQVDLERVEYGARLVYKTNNRANTRLYLNSLNAHRSNNKGSEILVSVGVQSNGISAEVYQHKTVDRYSNFSIEEKMSGASLAWKFGSKLKNIEDYRSTKEKHSFYQRDGIEDVKSLTLKQQAERLRTIRKQGEWDQNLGYAIIPGAFRYAQTVYQSRTGDCDEQSCMSATMSKLNGDEAYTVVWLDFGTIAAAHGAKIVKDSSNKQWFFVEYGTTYKINIRPEASIVEAAAAAVKQNHLYTSLPMGDATDPHFTVINCSDGESYNQMTASYVALGKLSSVATRPNIEYGAELFIGRDFLFE